MGEVVVETQCITQRGDNMSDASEISASSGESRLKRQRTDAMSEGGDGARVIVPNTQQAEPLGYTDPFRMRVVTDMWENESMMGASTVADNQEHHADTQPAAATVQEPAEWDTLFPQEGVLMFWGADVKISDYKQLATGFLETWYPPHGDQALSSGGSYYVQQMQKMFLSERSELEIDMTHMQTYSSSLFESTVDFPLEALPVLTEQVNLSFGKAVRLLEEHSTEVPDIVIRVFNMPTTRAMRDLRPEDIGKIVSIKGMVVRVTKLLPEMRTAMFECRDCFHKEYEPEERGRIDEPVACPNCGNRLCFELKHNQCQFIDKQFVRVQEAPDATPEGETPSSLSITLYGGLVDGTVPGDRIVMTGVYRAMPVRVSSNSAVCKSVFKTFIEASHLQKTTKGRSEGIGSEQGGACFSALYDAEPDEIERREAHLEPKDQVIIDNIHATAQHPDIYNILTRSLAPSIHGQEEVKMGVLCQLFGGTPKSFSMCHTRAEINILLCGDPGVAKSQVLSHVNSIASRGIYTSGKGSSSVGLTAFLVRDADTGEFVLESGALVLSDRGICCIDEFDKMDDSTRSVLHEVMEQQTVSIAKAGIICTLNARSSILAAANPKDSTWNKDYNILKNLDISSTLLSRFDLIYLLLDTKDTDLDRKLALHICQMYTADVMKGTTKKATQTNATQVGLIKGEPGSEFIAISDMSNYIAYAKAKIKPVLTKDAGSMLVKAYLAMRKQRGSRNVVTATTRQLEAMIRIAEAHAKMRLSAEVNEADVQAAKKLIETALRDSCTDPETGMLISAGGDGHSGITTHTIIKSIQTLIAQNKWVGKSVSLDEIRTKLIDILGRAISSADMMDAVAVVISRGLADPVQEGNLPFK